MIIIYINIILHKHNADISDAIVYGIGSISVQRWAPV